TYYGDHVKFRVYTDKYDSLKPELDKFAHQSGLTLRDAEKDLTLVGDLGHSRFLDVSRQDKTGEERAQLVLLLLHAIAELVIDELVPQGGGYWALEQNSHEENPNGSSFESLHHLFCIMTKVPLSILVLNESDPALYGTYWQPRKGEQDRVWQGRRFVE